MGKIERDLQTGDKLRGKKKDQHEVGIDSTSLWRCTGVMSTIFPKDFLSAGILSPVILIDDEIAFCLHHFYPELIEISLFSGRVLTEETTPITIEK